jgi:hypothetical protein
MPRSGERRARRAGRLVRVAVGIKPEQRTGCESAGRACRFRHASGGARSSTHPARRGSRMKPADAVESFDSASAMPGAYTGIQTGGDSPEAEWGCEPALAEDVARSAATAGHPVHRLRIDCTEALSVPGRRPASPLGCRPGRYRPATDRITGTCRSIASSPHRRRAVLDHVSGPAIRPTRDVLPGPTTPVRRHRRAAVQPWRGVCRPCRRSGLAHAGPVR